MSTFQIDFPGTPGQFATKASTAIKDKGGEFAGDESKGRFHIKTAAGAVEGTYQIAGPATGPTTPIAVTISKKPFFLPNHTIEEAIKGFF